jgi:hypothetical protein
MGIRAGQVDLRAPVPYGSYLSRLNLSTKQKRLTKRLGLAGVTNARKGLMWAARKFLLAACSVETLIPRPRAGPGCG